MTTEQAAGPSAYCCWTEGIFLPQCPINRAWVLIRLDLQHGNQIKKELVDGQVAA